MPHRQIQVRSSTRTIFRIVFISLALTYFIVKAIFNFMYSYHNLDPILLRPTREGIRALVYYELKMYKAASDNLRIAYNLAYDPAEVEGLKESLAARIQNYPDAVENYLWRADVCFSTGNYKDAAVGYRDALKADGSSYDAQVGLASGLIMQGDFKESQAVFREFLKSGRYGKYTTSLLNFLVALDALEHSDHPDKGELSLMKTYAYRYLRKYDPRKSRQIIASSDKALSYNGNLDEAIYPEAWFT